uniref:Uncharacterized protein n=1 Tax=Pyxicephalus adspersus TaxID=30357 RepID=A0AAV3ADQ5_PYXAD|nr:TPA: hypothetical protein GDO54_014432 [Pyxicephalus adspersus]
MFFLLGEEGGSLRTVPVVGVVEACFSVTGLLDRLLSFVAGQDLLETSWRSFFALTVSTFCSILSLQTFTGRSARSGFDKEPSVLPALGKAETSLLLVSHNAFLWSPSFPTKFCVMLDFCLSKVPSLVSLLATEVTFFPLSL